jgi:hypothetical protein
MTYSKQRLKEVTALKKAAVEKIRNDIDELNASPSRKYIEEFNQEFQGFDTVSDIATILEEAEKSNLIWIGDYHALPNSQGFAERFIRDLASRGSRNIVLAVEPVFARNQKILDRWMSGRISEQEFLSQMHYYDEWGCEWANYRVLFQAARELGIPVYGVDCHPRNDMRSIGRRDLGVARRVARLIEQDPSRTLIVLFGESHLASNHLPGRARTILERKGIAFKDLLILQNLDGIYWRLQECGIHNAAAVRLSKRRYCVFNATPIEKYESFRQYLYGLQDESAADSTLLAQTLMEVMVEFFAMKNVPEVTSAFMERCQIGAVAEEFARLIYQNCRRESDKVAARERDDEFFLTVIEHGLAYFCSKLLDSSRDGIEPLAERVLNQIAYDAQLTRAITLLVDPAKRPGPQHFAAVRAAIEAKAGRDRVMRMLGQLLGYALGRRLYHAYLQSRISRRQIRALFHDPLNAPNGPLQCYKQLHLL